MTLSKLDKLKASFAPKAKAEGQENQTWEKNYQFWKMNAGEQAVVRFLPDSNPDNERQFLVENHTHSLTINGKKRTVACLEMYEGYNTCPICKLSRDYYNQAKAAGETKENPGPLTAIGKKYYRKAEFIGQVKVVSSPFDFELNEGHTHEMPISIGPQIFKLINGAFASGDLEEVPYELKGGYDFRIMKTQQGDNANYSLSRFVPKQSDLDDDTIAQLNLYDLSTLRNKKVDAATLEVMLNADVTGQPLTRESFTGGDASQAEEAVESSFSTQAVADALTTARASVAETVVTPTAVVAPVASENKVNDIMEQIKARAAANKAAQG